MTGVNKFIENTEKHILDFAGADKERNTILVVPATIDKEEKTVKSVVAFNGSTFDLFQAMRASENGQKILEDLARLQLSMDSTIAEEVEANEKDAE